MLIQTLGRVCIAFVGIYSDVNNSATPRSPYKYRYLYQLSRLLKNVSLERIRQGLGLKKPNLNCFDEHLKFGLFPFLIRE